MNNNFKEIHIGSLIKNRVEELDIDKERICNFLGCSENQIFKMYEKSTADCFVLLRWSKLLEYDFFRIYSQHLILYSPQKKVTDFGKKKKSNLPQFRKSIYTIGIINFILEQIENKEKTRQQIIEEYNIPKTTLYKWINKYKK